MMDTTKLYDILRETCGQCRTSFPLMSGGA